jgi:hypothetical protein
MLDGRGKMQTIQGSKTVDRSDARCPFANGRGQGQHLNRRIREECLIIGKCRSISKHKWSDEALKSVGVTEGYFITRGSIGGYASLGLRTPDGIALNKVDYDVRIQVVDHA